MHTLCQPFFQTFFSFFQGLISAFLSGLPSKNACIYYHLFPSLSTVFGNFFWIFSLIPPLYLHRAGCVCGPLRYYHYILRCTRFFFSFFYMWRQFGIDKVKFRPYSTISCKVFYTFLSVILFIKVFCYYFIPEFIRIPIIPHLIYSVRIFLFRFLFPKNRS